MSYGNEERAQEALDDLIAEMGRLRDELRAASAVTARWVLLHGEARPPMDGKPVLLLSENGLMSSGEWTRDGWRIDGVFADGFGAGPIAYAPLPTAPRERRWNLYR